MARGRVREGCVPPAALSVKPKIQVLKYTTNYMHLGSQVPVLVEHNTPDPMIICMEQPEELKISSYILRRSVAYPEGLQHSPAH
jgi:hypothetical protein